METPRKQCVILDGTLFNAYNQEIRTWGAQAWKSTMMS